MIQNRISEVLDRIEGRVAGNMAGLSLLYTFVLLGGAGDHLEIGTLFGGSAIIAAIAKRDAGLDGKVVCVDPLDGYYIGDPTHGSRTDPVSERIPSPELVMENATRHNVEGRIRIVQERSVPFPKGLESGQYQTAYIDGDHWGHGPILDWVNVSMRTRKFVIIDNVGDGHLSVDRMVAYAVSDPGWIQVAQAGNVVVLGRDGRL